MRPRNILSLVAAFAVAWGGGLILGEYPFEGSLPVLGGFLMGFSVVSAAAWVESAAEDGRDDPPPWVIVLSAALAVWAIWRAAWIDAGAQGEILGLIPRNGLGTLPSVAGYAMAAAAVGALIRLIPKRAPRAAPEPVAHEVAQEVADEVPDGELDGEDGWEDETDVDPVGRDDETDDEDPAPPRRARRR